MVTSITCCQLFSRTTIWQTLCVYELCECKREKRSSTLLQCTHTDTHRPSQPGKNTKNNNDNDDYQKKIKQTLFLLSLFNDLMSRCWQYTLVHHHHLSIKQFALWKFVHSMRVCCMLIVREFHIDHNNKQRLAKKKKRKKKLRSQNLWIIFSFVPSLLYLSPCVISLRSKETFRFRNQINY